VEEALSLKAAGFINKNTEYNLISNELTVPIKKTY
jgi:hypothetical protein